jgi:putative flippase GtrA
LVAGRLDYCKEIFLTVASVFRKFAGFALAGGAATILNYSVFLVLLNLSVDVLLASAAGYISGILLSYLINVRFVFRETTVSLGGVLRYTVIYLLALPLQLGLLSLLLSQGVPAEIANALAIVVVLVVNFLVIRRFVFSSQP